MLDEHITNDIQILLVEDDDGDAKAIRRAFAKANISTPPLRVRDGLEALELLRNSALTSLPSAFFIVLDLKMPRMDGLEFLREIRADPSLRRITVFMLSTSADPRDLEAAYDCNVAGYILKANAGRNFGDLITALSHMWRLVEKPRNLRLEGLSS
jgi:CheY-like chemotaxis protein